VALPVPPTKALLSGFQAMCYTMQSSMFFLLALWSNTMLPHSGLNLVQVDAEAFGTKKCVHCNNFCENKLYSKINVAESDNSFT
jgi:hypothetical protein